MSVLAAAITAALTTSEHDLVVLDRDTGDWRRRPWGEVHAQAERIAGRGVEIRGASLMSGYLGDAPLRPESWFPTGDLGYLTDDGELVVCGRAKEVISVAGRNVFPTEVERVAAGVPGVRDGAVVAVGTGDGASRPGLVVTAEFRGRDRAGARSEVMTRVAAECGIVPADVLLVPPGSLPRTSSGKLRRLAVRQDLEAAAR